MVVLIWEGLAWSTKPGAPYENVDTLGFKRYHLKKEESLNNPYLEERKDYSEKRGDTWYLKNRIFHKIKDNFAEFEELLSSQNVIAYKFESPHIVYFFLSSGIFVSVFLNLGSDGNFTHERIYIDRGFVNRVAEPLTHGLFLESCIVLCGVEPKLNLIQFSKKLEFGLKLKKLSTLEPKVTSVILPGFSATRPYRLLDYCPQTSLILVWWSQDCEGARVWRPTLLEENEANVLVYRVDGQTLEFLALRQTRGDPLLLCFSSSSSYSIISVEQDRISQQQTTVILCKYELLQNCLVERVSQTDIPVQVPAVCASLDPQELRLLIGCKDGTIIMHHIPTKFSTLTKALFPVNNVSWHPDSCLFLACSKDGKFQCFDLALSCLSCQLLSESVSPQQHINISCYFKSPLNVKDVIWWRGGCIILFERGSIVSLRLCSNVGLVELISGYLRSDSLTEAASLLSCLNWNSETSRTMICFNLVARHLLKQPLSPRTEELLETVLGLFHNPQQELSSFVLLEYGFHVRCLTRNFFHLLLRYCRVERAFCLAVDLRDADLFMDLYYFGVAQGEKEMAAAAWEKAKQCRALADVEHSDLSVTESSYSSEQDHNSENINHLTSRFSEIRVNGHSEVMVDDIPPFRDKTQLRTDLKKIIGEQEDEESHIEVVHFGVV